MIKLFKERKIDYAFQIANNSVVQKINHFSDYQIMEEDIDALAKKISEENKINPIEVDYESREGKLVNENVSGMKFPQGYDINPNESMVCAKAVYTFKVSGNLELFSFQPKNMTFNKNVEASINNTYLNIEHQTFSQKPLREDKISEVKESIKETIDLMKKIIPVINSEVVEYNKTLEGKAKEILKKRKEQIESELNQDDDINDF
ncbi:hypothetical protein [Tenacibaculum sp.]|uniref:hypothetical protein n=1 Tax=Tenacibaculum sp. TaxID=1906242 RepID=UPI003D11035C